MTSSSSSPPDLMPRGLDAAEAARPEPEGAPGRNTCFVCVMLVQVAQALMSFDGGATQMSQVTLLAAGWTQGWLGCLGAMDKFGQTLTAPIWGRVLSTGGLKILLVLGLFLKALSCLGFGMLASKPLMLGAKFGMGAFEALVGIWAMAWINGNAPSDEDRGKWQGFLSISAGLGSGVGSGVAGLFGRSMGYGFAFEVQAAALFVIGLLTLWTPGFQLRTSPEVPQAVVEAAATVRPTLSTAEAPQGPSFGRSASSGHSMRLVWLNCLWRYVVLTMCMCIFIITGVSYMWQITFEFVWGFTDTQATLSFLVVTGVGGLLGTQIGPRLISKHLGGFGDPHGMKRCLHAFTRVTLAISVCGTITSLLMLRKAWHVLDYNLPQQAWGAIMILFLIGVFVLNGLINTIMGTLISISINAVEDHLRYVALGLTQSMQNVLGFALGMLLPSLLGDLNVHVLDPNRPYLVVHGTSSAASMAMPLACTWVLHLFMGIAAKEADVRYQRSLQDAHPRSVRIAS